MMTMAAFNAEEVTDSTVEPTGGAGDSILNFASVLAEASPALMLAMFVIALLRRWLILPRELDDCHKRIVELQVERDEFKTMLLRTLNLGERALSASRERNGHE